MRKQRQFFIVTDTQAVEMGRKNFRKWFKVVKHYWHTDAVVVRLRR